MNGDKAKEETEQTVVAETARIAESLSPDKAEALLDYAKFFAERAEQAKWDRRFSDPNTSPG